VQRTADEWMARFEGKDVCVEVVRTLQEAMADPQFRDRGLLRRSVVSDDHDALPAVSVPVYDPLRDPRTELRYPRLGEANAMLANPKSVTEGTGHQ
jgi:crotonobetainyl-CoA:carnitine CoA-transferase CaiB-like acyl-CoA transferase